MATVVPAAEECSIQADPPTDRANLATIANPNPVPESLLGEWGRQSFRRDINAHPDTGVMNTKDYAIVGSWPRSTDNLNCCASPFGHCVPSIDDEI